MESRAGVVAVVVLPHRESVWESVTCLIPVRSWSSGARKAGKRGERKEGEREGADLQSGGNDPVTGGGREARKRRAGEQVSR